MGSVFMIDLRVLVWAGMDQTLRQTTSRFGPWLTAALCVLLPTGVLMVIGEPVSELVSFSFWLKMFLVAVGTLIAAIFQITLRKHEQHWEETLVNRGSIKCLAVLTFLIWVCIIILGRLIAYDHVWGSLGVASTQRSFKQMASDILKWTWAAFALTALTGTLMFITNARVYYHNSFFRIKNSAACSLRHQHARI